MRAIVALTAFTLVLGLLAPAAAGYPQPVFYFLKSGCPVDEVENMCLVPELGPLPNPGLPPPVPPLPTVGVPQLSVADGIMDPYTPLKPNAPNSTEPDIKVIYPASEQLVPIRFLAPDNHTHPNRIKGPFILGVWTGESPAPYANLTATLYEVPVEGSPIALANATVAIDLNASKAPDPTALIPPNSTDPSAILFYELAQVLPLVLQPPLLFILGPVDIQFANTSSLAVGFALEGGSSPVGEPVGAATLRFNSTLSPSFVYVPWYAPDPPRPTFTSTYTFTSRTSTFTNSRGGTGSGGVGGSDGGGNDGGGNGIPGLEAGALVGLLALATLVARRRL